MLHWTYLSQQQADTRLEPRDRAMAAGFSACYPTAGPARTNDPAAVGRKGHRVERLVCVDKREKGHRRQRLGRERGAAGHVSHALLQQLLRQLRKRDLRAAGFTRGLGVRSFRRGSGAR